VAGVSSSARADDCLRRLADEQAALRRVATLVAEGVQPAKLFAAVTKEVARLFLDVEASLLIPSIVRFDPGPTFVLVGSSEPQLDLPIGSRWGPKDVYASTRILRSGRSASVDAADVAAQPGPDADLLRRQGFLHQVGSPITVEGRPWGAMTMNSSGALPPDTVARLERFTELIATAIANAESRDVLRQLADEQAALRRVATLVAQDVASDELFGAVAAEVGTLLGADYTGMIRYEPDATFVTTMATWAAAGEHPPAPTRFRVVPGDPTAMVAQTGKPARVNDWANVPGPIAEYVRRELGVRSSVGGPIVVNGSLWGALAVHSKRNALPPDTEARLWNFTELVATAIANTSARAEVSRLAQEQAALRRVATLVAQGGQPGDVFATVAAELAGLLQADHVVVGRYEQGSVLTVLASRGAASGELAPGTRISYEGDSVVALVWRTGRSARLESHQGVRGTLAELARATGVQVAVGAPVVVDGRLWGVATAGWSWGEPPPTDTEERMAKFAELLDSAIANADGRDQLTASRARLVTEADEARRRVVRDLHDGAQQRLLHAIMSLKLAQRALRANDERAVSLIAEALEHAMQGNAELRELAHGILPAVLARGGLRAGVDAVVSRLDPPVDVDVPAERFPAEIEASAYFVVAEALTNVVKHSRAGSAAVRAFVDGPVLRVEVRDDGLGGADPDGHGLTGLGDRVTALGGQFSVESPAGAGTVVSATLPLDAT
jgi:signal transduction histidine kinase